MNGNVMPSVGYYGQVEAQEWLLCSVCSTPPCNHYCVILREVAGSISFIFIWFTSKMDSATPLRYAQNGGFGSFDAYPPMPSNLIFIL